MTLRSIALQVPLSMGFPKQEYWSGLSFLSPGVLPDPGIESASAALAGKVLTTEPGGKPHSLAKQLNSLSEHVCGHPLLHSDVIKILS